jgi:hypothetical protein
VELRDIIVTPFIIALVYIGAYLVRPRLTDHVIKQYFIPALTVKILGALALGFIYQFYYGGGDTFNFHTHGSRHVWEAFMDSPLKGLQLLFTSRNQTGVYQYSSQIGFFNDPPSYFIVKIAAIFDLLTFSSYSATAVLFSLVGFIGMWMFFLTFYLQYPALHKGFALASLFLPSLIFWGSGILKDTITLACLGISTYYLYQIFLKGKVRISSILILLLSLFSIFTVRKFMLQAYLPSVILWIFLIKFRMMKSMILKIISFPLVIAIIGVSAYYTVIKVGEGDEKYSVNKLVKTAQITSYDIRFYSGRNAGSGYTLGTIDGSWQTMLRLAPVAINVSLFRPYLWEVKNPLMLLSALEGLFLLVLTVYVIAIRRSMIFEAIKNPNVIFLLMFSLVFAYAVGVSTFNFGTLARYKIPLLPFYTSALVILLNFKSKDSSFPAP